jgi:hypothetical protein
MRAPDGYVLLLEKHKYRIYLKTDVLHYCHKNGRTVMEYDSAPFCALSVLRMRRLIDAFAPCFVSVQGDTVLTGTAILRCKSRSQRAVQRKFQRNIAAGCGMDRARPGLRRCVTVQFAAGSRSSAGQRLSEPARRELCRCWLSQSGDAAVSSLPCSSDYSKQLIEDGLSQWWG